MDEEFKAKKLRNEGSSLNGRSYHWAAENIGMKL